MRVSHNSDIGGKRATDLYKLPVDPNNKSAVSVNTSAFVYM